MRLFPLLFLPLLVGAPKKPDVFVPPGFWKPLPPPERGEWRDRRREEGQTFAEYRSSRPARPTATRTRIYLQPMLTRPPGDPRLLERLAAVLGAACGREATTLEPLALPAEAYDTKRRQFAVLDVARALRKRLPADAALMLAVTDRDLSLPGFSFAYGWGSPRLRVALLSLARLGDERDPARARRRFLASALHEGCHSLSLPHCVFFHCLMNPASHLDEIDARPLLLCPVCRAKVCWNLGLDPLDRYGELEAALARAGLPGEAVHVRRAAGATRAAGGRDPCE